MVKIRADQLVVLQGLAETREKAKRLIMAGQIHLSGFSNPVIKVEKPGQLLADATVLALDSGPAYVSRGAYKLLTLLDGFKLDVSGFVCLDAGASTGGFTDCLLQRGAAHVYAVDVGKNQLHEKLRADARVTSMEGINLRYARPDLIPEPVDLITGDLSFISLTLALPPCLPWLRPGGLAALLVKPQFELTPAQIHKGVVRREEDRQEAVRKIISFFGSLGLKHLGTLPAQIKGPKGNQEYMTLFRKDEQERATEKGE